MAKRRGGRRRGNDDGSVYLRTSDQRWVVAISLGGGKRKVEYAATEQEGKTKLRELQNAKAAGQNLGTEHETIAQYLEQWLATTARRRVRPTTLQVYESRTRTHLIPALGKHRLRKLQRAHVQALWDDLEEQGRARSSIEGIRALLFTALEDARADERILRNPVEFTEIARQDAKPEVMIDIDLAQRILDATANTPVAMEVRIALVLGLRSGEIRGLQWSDIDLSAGELTVRRTVQLVAGKHRFGEPKTEAGQRIIPIPEELVDLLRQHRIVQNERRLKGGGSWQQHNLVFPGPRGTIQNAQLLIDRFQRALVAAGLPRLRFHDLRHGCASILAAMGVEPRVAMEILGHTDPAFTLRKYTKALRENKRAATAAVNQVLSFRSAS